MMMTATTMETMMNSNDVRVYDGLALEDRLAELVADAKFMYGHHSNKSLGYAHWNYDIVKSTSKNINPIGIPSDYNLLWGIVAPLVPIDAYPIRLYANLHTFGLEGYPHSDSPRNNETTIITYLNREWKREWGGETAFYDGQEIVKSVMPKFGRVVCFPSRMTHCARAVSRICPEARVTLIVKVRHPQDDPDLVKLSGFLSFHGAKLLKHSGGTLHDHLIRVYELLKAKDLPKNICLAGGLHSVYGTNSYKHKLITSRDTVQAAFGDLVDNLVFTFSIQDDRPQVFEDSPTWEPLLRIIECANLLDQNSLKKYPNLHKLWRTTHGAI